MWQRNPACAKIDGESSDIYTFFGGDCSKTSEFTALSGKGFDFSVVCGITSWRLLPGMPLSSSYILPKSVQYFPNQWDQKLYNTCTTPKYPDNGKLPRLWVCQGSIGSGTDICAIKKPTSAELPVNTLSLFWCALAISFSPGQQLPSQHHFLRCALHHQLCLSTSKCNVLPHMSST